MSPTDKTSKRWIKLTTRTSDAKLMRVAALTGVDRKAVYWSIINWFWYLDDNRDETIVVTESGFHDIAVWTFEPSLLAACAHETVNWLERAGNGLWRPTRPDSHFSQKAKDRATSGRRMKDIRSRMPDVAPNVAPQAQHLSVSDSGSGSISVSEIQEIAGEKMRAGRARAGKADDGFAAAADAIALWALRTPYEQCLSGMKTAIEKEIRTIGDAEADIRLIPRAVAHLKAAGRPCKGVGYARAVILTAIQERAWEAVVPIQSRNVPVVNEPLHYANVNPLPPVDTSDPGHKPKYLDLDTYTPENGRR